jgi:hypothetical protein
MYQNKTCGANCKECGCLTFLIQYDEVKECECFSKKNNWQQ